MRKMNTAFRVTIDRGTEWFSHAFVAQDRPHSLSRKPQGQDWHLGAPGEQARRHERMDHRAGARSVTTPLAQLRPELE